MELKSKPRVANTRVQDRARAWLPGASVGCALRARAAPRRRRPTAAGAARASWATVCRDNATAETHRSTNRWVQASYKLYTLGQTQQAKPNQWRTGDATPAMCMSHVYYS